MKNKQFGKKLLYVAFPIIIILSKIIRYTVLKTTLADAARGDDILYDIIYNTDLHYVGSSGFNNAAVFFKMINFLGLTTYTQFEIYITIVWNLLVMLVLLNMKKINNKEFIYLAFTIGALNIFAFTLAKDPIQMLYFLIIYYIFTRNISPKKKMVYSLLVILLITVTYRRYYILMFGYSIIMFLIFKYIINGKKEKNIIYKLALIIAILGIFHFSFMSISKRLFVEEYKEMIWVRTKSYKANTAIMSKIPGSANSSMLFTLDYLLVLIRLLFPFELLKYAPQQWIFLLYQIIITIYILKTIKNYKANDKEQNLALALYLGFVCASASFEPDFGSWIRHQAVAFPLMIIMMRLHKVKGGDKNEENRTSNMLLQK